MKLKMTCAVMVGALGLSQGAVAALSAEEIARLGDDLTIWGAIKAGNEAGTIPAYTGPIKPPASYDPSNPGQRPDPFADEEPLFTITAANMAEYADRLSAGTQQMLRQYPNYRLNVYPTHRTANYPDYVLDNTLKNAATCELAENRLQLAGECYGGVPFPIPKNGSEVMWNRTLKYDQYAYESPAQTSTMVDTRGRIIETGAFEYWQTFPHYEPGRTTPIAADEMLEYGRIDWTGPARKAGERLVIHDNVDMLGVGRRAWSYLPGQRRVKLSPDVAYDTPSVAGGGIGTTDDTQVFYGAQDRYNFELVGRREMFIPYNTFRLHDNEQCSTEQVFTPNHLNPDCVRWELHRVWEVEATLKDGMRHVYPRRTFYWDEDLPGVGMADNYDDADKLYRVTVGHYYPFYETTGHNTHEFVVHDLASGGYVRQAYTPADGDMMVVTPSDEAHPPRFYQSSTLARGGVR